LFFARIGEFAMCTDPTSASATPTIAPPAAKPDRSTKPRPPAPLPQFHVILLNDDDHTYEYVIEMLRALFGYQRPRGFQLASEVDTQGRVIVMTTHKEQAELKRDQIHAYGADSRIARCRGSMSAVIEPAPG
jgi:ATP-dependent Clp protease adaptor protein ClpS